MPDLDRVKEAFEQNSDGTFTWKERPLHHFPDLRAMRIWNTKYAGKVAVGSNRKNGYIYLSFDNKCVSAHRLSWYFNNGSCDPQIEIDHRNGIRSDNRIENLRIATPNNNQHNRQLQKNNSSGAKNVYWSNQNNCWKVKMNFMRKDYYFGLFSNKDDAIKAATEGRNLLHKEFANHGKFQSSENIGLE